METVMDHAWRRVRDMAKDRKVPLRRAAFMVAIQRVYEAAKLRGL